MDEHAFMAIQAVQSGQQAFCKFLSANDSGATGAHQAGILVSKSAAEMMFDTSLGSKGIMKRTVRIQWQDDFYTESCFTYYSSKNELRITQFGRSFPFLKPDQTGSLFVFVRNDVDSYQGYFLETEDDINTFLEAFNISSTETNRLINIAAIQPQARENLAIRQFIQTLEVNFPISEEMSAAARRIQNAIYDHQDYIQTNPDGKLIAWTNMEYTLFRALEHERYGTKISNGFASVEDFINTANEVLNRRKSRAGKSLEHHLSAIFDGNDIQYRAQATTEGNKKPDFLFPSQEAYHNVDFPTEHLISLAAKTTCKDRWRQVINEADRLRDRPKYLCTLQQGISPAQMDEMQAEQVILVVPKPFIQSYPADRRERIWTLSRFVQYVRETESV